MKAHPMVFRESVFWGHLKYITQIDANFAMLIFIQKVRKKWCQDRSGLKQVSAW